MLVFVNSSTIISTYFEFLPCYTQLVVVWPGTCLYTNPCGAEAGLNPFPSSASSAWIVLLNEILSISQTGQNSWWTDMLSTRQMLARPTQSHRVSGVPSTKRRPWLKEDPCFEVHEDPRSLSHDGIFSRRNQNWKSWQFALWKSWIWVQDLEKVMNRDLFRWTLCERFTEWNRFRSDVCSTNVLFWTRIVNKVISTVCFVALQNCEESRGLQEALQEQRGRWKLLEKPSIRSSIKTKCEGNYSTNK